jgi:TusA-related sulfurtransferase
MGQATQQRTTVDVRGEICPYPMLRAKAAMEGAVLGEVLDLLTDHPPALTTVPWQAQKLGFTAEVQELGGAEWKITLSPAEDT